MIYLGLDTSTNVLSVALGDENRIIAEFSSNLRQDHATRLMPAIENLLATSNLQVSDIGAIVVAEGPGSYTGLRIGLSTAKTLAWARKLPLYTVSSLAMMAGSAKHFPGLIVPMIDARRGQVFTGLYQGSSKLERLLDDRLIILDEWIEELISFNKDKGPIIFLGTDLSLHEDTILASGLATAGIHYELADLASQPGRASELIVLAQAEKARLEQAGNSLASQSSSLAQEHEDARSVSPNYLRIVEAEYRLLEAQKDKKI